MLACGATHTNMDKVHKVENDRVKGRTHGSRANSFHTEVHFEKSYTQRYYTAAWRALSSTWNHFIQFGSKVAIDMVIKHYNTPGNRTAFDVSLLRHIFCFLYLMFV